MGSLGKSFALLLALVFLTSLVTLQPAIVKAAPKTITVPDDYPTIQEAIDNASAGDTVFVKKGTYNTYQIRIDKPISLIGEDSQKTVIIGHYAYASNHILDVGASNVTISGFNITGDDRQDIMVGIAIAGDTSGIKIIGNNIKNTDKGVCATSPPGQNLLVSENNITRNGWGIYTSFSNSVISNNYVGENSVNGIRVDECQNVTIKQNKIIGNTGGLFLGWTGPFYVYENNISGNLGFGVQFAENCSYSMIYNNNIAKNQIGVGLNNVSESFIGVGNKVYYNNLIDNGKSVIIGGIGRTDVVSWDNGAVGNYWSDYDGQGTYVIDENNVDHHPLTQQVNISTTAPTMFSNLLTIAIIAIVAVLVAVVLLVVYRRHRKIA